MLSLLLMASMAAGPDLPEAAWHDGLDWHGVHVSMQRNGGDGYLLEWPTGKRVIPAPPLRVATASPLFDGLYAMAQDDLRQDSVEAIRDGAFDHGQPIPCLCFETGEKWPYVWTRDLSYAIDLGLWRFDARRSRNGLAFKLSDVRVPAAPQGLYVMQDTGSGGSWPISTDRIVWFLGARHLLDDAGFADQAGRALADTLAQDRQYAFDPAFGLYRGETSFLDWREQTYPAWTADNVRFIAQSFALSTNVLHYQALRMAAELADRHRDPRAAGYRTQAEALKAAINRHFWRADRGLYMSYIGGDGLPVEAYDLLGTSLAITSGVADPARARQALANYPTWPAGSPVVWPERADQPIYHNRAIWPFVSAYALRAARAVDDPARIAHEIRSVVRGAALAGSNMENYELLTQGVHLDDGPRSGPVVNSPRQLWSVAGFLDVAIEGVFGLAGDGRVEPKLPVSLVPMLFGDSDHIDLQTQDRRITLRRPARLDGNLLVADATEQQGDQTVITLKAITVPEHALRSDAPLYAPATPPAPDVEADGDQWRVRSPGKGVLYVNGRRHGTLDTSATLPRTGKLQCIRVTHLGADGVESLPSPEVCPGRMDHVAGAWPRGWTAPATGRYRAMLDYANPHGPINTGITAAVKWLVVDCGEDTPQRLPLVMPHSVGRQPSTWGDFTAKAGQRCRFRLDDGFNMSYLRHNAHYTGGAGGDAGSLNQADVGDLLIAPL
ncbi:MAG TPA: Six-hairpin glycosidase-like protein [Frateuria sp.]|uniref:Six-hairpin glycosidase-like protein n=1 Tax=Frateuria sp. TaxID=2211372 RepID=UPI002D7EF25B|nr:Six-hairpin glycosidase-like protein [Frateuria sp.]HET6805024.1 Six-hairpin glycosidase-like protein [Frateuria sp.]